MSNERGFTVCRAGARLVPGPVVTGSPEHVDVPLECPAGSEPVGLFHTHPRGATPSARDIAETIRLGLDFVCAQAPSGETKCVDVRTP